MKIIDPMLAELTKEPVKKLTEQGEHIFEWKYDGTRVVAHIDNGVVTLINRHGNDVTNRYPELYSIPEYVNCKKAILDGEIVCFDERGLPSWSRVQQRLGKTNPVDVAKVMKEYPATYVAFDIISAGGIDFTAKGEAITLLQRKELLSKLVTNGAVFCLARHVSDGATLYANVKKLNAEGVMAKRKDSLYYEGKRSELWKKIKPRKKDTFVVCGYTRGEGSRASQFGALILGKPALDGTYRYVGRVGSGLNEALMSRLFIQLESLKTDVCPMTKGTKVQKLASWVRPEMIVEAYYYELSNSGKLRWPIFKSVCDSSLDEVTPEINAIIEEAE